MRRATFHSNECARTDAEKPTADDGATTVWLGDDGVRDELLALSTDGVTILTGF
jgi:hypothetical protein